MTPSELASRLAEIAPLSERATGGRWQVDGVRAKWREAWRPGVNDAHAIGPDGDTVALVLYHSKQHAVCWADANWIVAAVNLVRDMLT